MIIMSVWETSRILISTHEQERRKKKENDLSAAGV